MGRGLRQHAAACMRVARRNASRSPEQCSKIVVRPALRDLGDRTVAMSTAYCSLLD
jgi:hypothetical protein